MSDISREELTRLIINNGNRLNNIFKEIGKKELKKAIKNFDSENIGIGLSIEYLTRYVEFSNKYKTMIDKITDNNKEYINTVAVKIYDDILRGGRNINQYDEMIDDIRVKIRYEDIWIQLLIQLEIKVILSK